MTYVKQLVFVVFSLTLIGSARASRTDMLLYDVPDFHSIKDFPESIKICTSSCGTNKAIIQKVKFRSYVLDVLALEWGLDYFDKEAIKVGAVLVKQFAMYHIFHDEKHPGYDLDSSQRDQVYSPGAFQKKFRNSTPEVREKFLSALNESWNAIIFRNGEFFETQYDAGRENKKQTREYCNAQPRFKGRVSQHGAHDLANGCKGDPAYGRRHSMEEIIEYYYGRNNHTIEMAYLPSQDRYALL